MRRSTCQEIDELAERKSDVLRMFSKWSTRDPSNQRMPSQANSANAVEDCCPVIPPVEQFLDLSSDTQEKILSPKFFADIRKGDIIYGSVSSKLISGLSIKLLACEWSQMARSVAELGIKAFCPTIYIPTTNPRQDPVDAFEVKDTIRAVVTDVNPEHEKIVVSLSTDDLPKDGRIQPLGIISSEELPKYYGHLLDNPVFQRDDLTSYVRNQREFENPAFLEVMRDHLGVPEIETNSRWYSLLPGFCGKHVAVEEKGDHLTKVQSQRWSMKSVEEGIKFLKAGDLPASSEALNKAVELDKNNVEARVARGALFTKKEDYHRAIKDYEEALRLRPSHRNAKKYLADTFFALGKKFEQDEPERALRCYKDALRWDPDFDQATAAKNGLLHRDQPKKSKVAPETLSAASTAEKLRRMLSSDSSEPASTRAKRKRRSPNASSESDHSPESGRNRDRSRTYSASRNGAKEGSSRSRPESSQRSRSRGRDPDRRPFDRTTSASSAQSETAKEIPTVKVDVANLAAQLEKFKAEKKAQALATNKDVQKRTFL